MLYLRIKTSARCIVITVCIAENHINFPHVVDFRTFVYLNNVGFIPRNTNIMDKSPNNTVCTTDCKVCTPSRLVEHSIHNMTRLAQFTQQVWVGTYAPCFWDSTCSVIWPTVFIVLARTLPVQSRLPSAWSLGSARSEPVTSCVNSWPLWHHGDYLVCCSDRPLITGVAVSSMY